MQTHQIIDSNHLETCLFKFCRSGSTGTVFITTDKNQSCQIILEDGEVKAAALGQKRGFEAILELKETRVKRYSFIQNMKFPLSIYANIICSDTVLEILGYNVNDISNSRMYAETQDTFYARQL
ncbi:hypothetical protein OO007_17430 [Cocleimonas sp. KMM 6892]|uniref:hypothetical protein n=1 Tax=unclassified Cocleimonas TaxID=2639732 RepID=UPI002DC0054A|nr:MULTISPECIES: hypothetical protein [unclassified Cocleimonas]MEB8434025.1 hypothetical protein [Cocleimonas sp. KMM 6892]MEC4716836.1 hypothetical protein [Cocleimonas sp. KMM 6895]MEC4746009.1 hypothetical protein [Cocleimonas sp. KMM 6896]